MNCSGLPARKKREPWVSSSSSPQLSSGEAWPVLRESPVRVSMTLQCGPSEDAELQAAFKGSGLDGEVTAFLDDMPAAYARASLIVSRSVVRS